MKLTLLSKTVSTIGLVAVLAAMVGTSAQQVAQAQAPTEIGTGINEEACMASGVNSFFVLQGVNFSAEQLEEVDKISAEAEEIYNRLYAAAERVDNPNAPVEFVVRPGVKIQTRS